MSEIANTRIESLILANHVEAINGLLYVSGGGWTDLHREVRGGMPPVTHFGVGLIVGVPWNDTNMPHHFDLFVQNEDETETLASVGGDFVLGRPPQLTRGELQHAVLAVSIDLVFPKQGSYCIVAKIDGEGSKVTWLFRIHDNAVPASTLKS